MKCEANIILHPYWRRVLSLVMISRPYLSYSEPTYHSYKKEHDIHVSYTYELLLEQFIL